MSLESTICEYLGVGAADHPYIENVISSAYKVVESLCGRTLALTTYTDELYDGGEKVIRLSCPIIITELTPFTLKVNDTIVDTNLYYLYPDTGILRYPFPDGHQMVKITYTAGYADEDLPQALVLAICIMSKALLAKMQQKIQMAGIQSESIGDYSYSLYAAESMKEASIPGEIYALIHDHKRSGLI